MFRGEKEKTLAGEIRQGLMEEEVEYYQRKCERLGEIARAWERVADNMAAVAEERRKIIQDTRFALGLWIGLAVFEAVLLLMK